MLDHSGTRVSRYLVALLLVVGLAGCGISASDAPVDEGDAVAGDTSTTNAEIKFPPSPDAARTADQLVQDFLMAASGGTAVANEQVKAFLTGTARDGWRDLDNPPLTIVRTVEGPSTGAAVNDSGRFRTPVTVRYQVVGTLGDQGFIDELRDLTAVGTMVFWVVQQANNSGNLRVDEITGAPTGLILSDQALTEYYRPQPIYFWDQTSTSLVPDLRYVPLTITAPQRANQLLRWLVAGPSPWLSGGVLRMPQYITSDPPQSDNGTLVVKLSPLAASGGPDGLKRLMFQLQWSLSTPRIALSIDDVIQPPPATETEYLQHNISRIYDSSPQRYDINADQKVVPVPESVQGPAVLGMPENANVVFAGIGHGGAVAAFVRTVGNSRRLHIVREGMPGRFEPNLQSTSLGRPAFIPSSDLLLIATGGPSGKLYRVSTSDGTAADVTPRNLSGVTAVSVSPDGRRVALIAGGQAYVSSLSVANNTVTIGSSPRPVLANQLTTTAVTWTDEAWLYVAGTSGGAPAMWHVTADSVVAENVSDSLRGLRVDDLVAYPKGPGSGSADVLAYTQSGVYTYFSQLTPSEQPVRFFGTP